MNLHVFCIHVTIATLLLRDALPKTLPDAGEVASEPEEREKGAHEAQHHPLKHAHEGHAKRYNRRRRGDDEGFSGSKNKPCAVMYKNEEPVGVLQPYQDGYQLLPIHSDESIPVDISPMGIPVQGETQKRDAGAGELDDETEEEKEDDAAPFTDEKYPYIFAKFKIDSRVEKEGSQRNRGLVKREYKNPTLFNERHVNSLRSTLSRIEANNDKGAEAELKGILNDMGLIEDTPIEKRDAELIEDEDMEHGTNKINLIKLANNNEKQKRSEKASKPAKAVTKHYAMIDIPEPRLMNEDEYIDQYMKKHPDQFNQNENKERGKRSENMAEQMEKQIKERLQKIKEEVKNEIESIKGNDDHNNEDLVGEEDEDEGEGSEDKVQRRKRDAINTLVEEETSDLNPVLAGENNLAPHVRRRRSLDENIKAGRPKNENVKIDVNDASLIIDLNPENYDVRAKEKLSLDYTSLPKQYVLTTTTGYITRNLKRLEADEDASSDFDEDDNENMPVREKKACKCSGHGCKCNNQPKPLMGVDGSNFIYFDGAPRLLAAPFVQKTKGDNEVAMKFLPQTQDMRKRPVRQGKNMAKIETNILQGLRDGGYVLDLDPDVFKITEQNPKSLTETRHKRDSFLDLVAIHGGSPVLNHLVAIRERTRPKRKAQKLTLTDMSHEDLFGALPQGYEGNLARFKRVKRAT